MPLRQHQDCFSTPIDCRTECRFDILRHLARLGIEASLRKHLRRSRFLLTLARCLEWSKCRERPSARAGEQFLQKLQCLPLISGARLRQSRNIPARSRQAGDEAIPNRIDIARHHNGNRNSSCLGGASGSRTARDDSIYLEPHELSRKLRKSIEFAISISILEDNITPLYIPELAQALPKCLDYEARSEEAGDTI